MHSSYMCVVRPRSAPLTPPSKLVASRPMSRHPAPHEVLHVAAAVRVDDASTYAVAQAVPKLEEGAAPCGFVVAVGAVVVDTTRCRRRTSRALSEFTLPDFPPGKCEVLTPRQDPEMDDTWLPVVGHREGYLIVRNEDGEEEPLSLHAVNRLFAKGKAIKRMLQEDGAPPQRRVVRRLALQELGQQDEVEQEGEDNDASAILTVHYVVRGALARAKAIPRCRLMARLRLRSQQ